MNINETINERIKLLNLSNYCKDMTDTQKYCVITGMNINNFVTDINSIPENMSKTFFNYIPSGIGLTGDNYSESTTGNEIATEEELFASFINGGEIKLAKSFNIESSIIVESNTVLNLNNQSIVNTKVINNDCTTFEVKNGAKLTIEGNGVVKSVAETSKDYSSAVWANGGYVEIKGGQFENEGDSTDLIYASNGGNIVIEGGIFKASGPADVTDNNGTSNIHSALNVKDANYKDGTSSIIVKGGTFYNFNPANNLSEGKNTNFVAEGYTVVVNGVENLDCYTSEMGEVIYEVVKK